MKNCFKHLATKTKTHEALKKSGENKVYVKKHKPDKMTISPGPLAALGLFMFRTILQVRPVHRTAHSKENPKEANGANEMAQKSAGSAGPQPALEPHNLGLPEDVSWPQMHHHVLIAVFTHTSEMSEIKQQERCHKWTKSKFTRKSEKVLLGTSPFRHLRVYIIHISISDKWL